MQPFDQSPRQAPRKISGFVFDKDEPGRAASEVLVRARAEFDGQGEMLLGVLQPDSNGYLSFSVPDLLNRNPTHIWLETANGGTRLDALTMPQDRAGVVQFQLETEGKDRTGESQPAFPGSQRSIQHIDMADVQRSPRSISRRAELVLGDGACQVPMPNSRMTAWRNSCWDISTTIWCTTTAPSGETRMPTNGC